MGGQAVGSSYLLPLGKATLVCAQSPGDCRAMTVLRGVELQLCSCHPRGVNSECTCWQPMLFFRVVLELLLCLAISLPPSRGP